MNRSGLLLLLIVYIPFMLISQPRFVPGYYISLENDTVHGYFKGRVELKNFKLCKFYPNPGDEAVIYKPGTILAYRIIEGKYYVSKAIGDSDTLFLEFLLNGIADLYYFKDFGGPHYLIEKDQKLIQLSAHEDVLYEENKKTIQQNVENQTGLLNYFFSDCMPIQPEIEDVNLSHSSLINLTKEYHQYTCGVGEECIIYEKKLPAIRVGISPVVGYYFSTFRITDDTYLQVFDYTNSNYPVCGLSMSLNAPRSSEKIFLHLEALYGRFSTSAYKTIDNNINDEYHSVSIDYTFIKMAIPISYTFSTGKLRPDIIMGGGMIRTMNPETGLTIGVEHEGDYIWTQFEEPRVDRWFACGFVRAGASYHFSTRRYLFLNLGYEFSSGLTLEYATYINSFCIHAGFYF